MMFKSGDFVIRINKPWGICRVGETYLVTNVDDEIYVKIAGSMGAYDAKNFVLHPANNSPLMEALK
jgi:hypothetical protein